MKTYINSKAPKHHTWTKSISDRQTNGQKEEQKDRHLVYQSSFA